MSGPDASCGASARGAGGYRWRSGQEVAMARGRAAVEMVWLLRPPASTLRRRSDRVETAMHRVAALVLLLLVASSAGGVGARRVERLRRDAGDASGRPSGHRARGVDVGDGDDRRRCPGRVDVRDGRLGRGRRLAAPRDGDDGPRSRDGRSGGAVGGAGRGDDGGAGGAGRRRGPRRGGGAGGVGRRGGRRGSRCPARAMAAGPGAGSAVGGRLGLLPAGPAGSAAG